MKMNAPKKGTWTVSILLGAAAILNHYSSLSIPIVNEGEFIILTLAFLLLLLGSELKGL